MRASIMTSSKDEAKSNLLQGSLNPDEFNKNWKIFGTLSCDPYTGCKFCKFAQRLQFNLTYLELT